MGGQKTEDRGDIHIKPINQYLTDGKGCPKKKKKKSDAQRSASQRSAT